MRIEGYNPDSTYLNRAYTIPSSTDAAAVKPELKQGQPSNKDESNKAENLIEEKPQKVNRSNASLGDVAVSLGNRDISLVGLGSDGTIQSGIMRKAVSAMQKDSVLHEYQYFVGNGVPNTKAPNGVGEIISDDEDGIIIRK
jgi:hypothetical protein